MHWISLVKLSDGLRREERRDKSTVASIRTTALATVFWCLLALSGAQGLVIKDSQVPTVAQQMGSTDPVVLDCDYEYKMEEKNGLVVKWYRESGPTDNKTSEQVYQWIAPRNPQDLGVLKGRLNITYEASTDPYKKHRALNIVNPTINLTGVYKCHVSTNFHDAYKWQKVVIYSPARDMTLESSPLSGSNKVNVSCAAKGIYPEPSAEMIVVKGSKTTRTVVNDTTQLVVPKEGLYDITVYKIFDDSTLAAETQFECILTVPDTKYYVRKSLVYYPGQETSPDVDSKQTNSNNNRAPLSDLKNDPSNRNPASSSNSSPAGSGSSSLALYHYSIGTSLVQLVIVLLSYVGHQ